MTESDWYTETTAFVDKFIDWAGKSEILRQSLTIMWMGWRTRDIDILSSLTGYDIQTITYFVNRAIANKIWLDGMKMNANDWFPVEDGGNGKDEFSCTMAILLDAMTIAGCLEVDTDSSGHIYKTSDQITDTCIVQRKSGRGPHFKIADVRISNGERQVKLNRNIYGATIKVPCGPWRPASDYIVQFKGDSCDNIKVVGLDSGLRQAVEQIQEHTSTSKDQ